MVVTWSTIHHINDHGEVQFADTEEQVLSATGDEAHSKKDVKAETTHFKDGTNLYTYRALLTGLKPATKYCECLH